LFLFVFFNRKRAAPEAARSKAVPICCSAAAIIVLVVLSGSGFTHSRQAIAHFRNFYGTLSVILRGGGLHNAGLTLAHGRVAHGFQLQAAAHRHIPTAYYAFGSGLDHAFQLASSAARAERPTDIHIGVI